MAFLSLGTTNLHTLSLGEKNDNNVDHLAIPVLSWQPLHPPNLPLGVHHYNFLALTPTPSELEEVIVVTLKGTW